MILQHLSKLKHTLFSTPLCQLMPRIISSIFIPCCSYPEAKAAWLPVRPKFWAVLGTLLSKPTSYRFYFHSNRPHPTMNVLAIISKLLKMETLTPKLKLKPGKQWKSDSNGVATMKKVSVSIWIGILKYTIWATPALVAIKVCQSCSSTEAALPQHFHH